jgi:hypothetical protein
MVGTSLRSELKIDYSVRDKNLSMGIRYLLVTRTNEAEYGDDFLPMGDIPYPT